MLPLCGVLNITVNDLLSGQRVSETNYQKKAEENMMSLIKENEENKKRPVTEKITLKTNPTQMRTSQKHNGYSQEDTGKKTRKILYWGGIVAIAAIVAVIVIRNN